MSSNLVVPVFVSDPDDTPQNKRGLPEEEVKIYVCFSLSFFSSVDFSALV